MEVPPVNRVKSSLHTHIYTFLAINLSLLMHYQPGYSQDVHLNAPEGFRVQLFADDNLAHNIYSMTIDTKGHVVVSGPGYIRRLIDDDGDGKADRTEEVCKGPKSGAQGLLFDGTNLFCTADGGLLRYYDKNEDGIADGDPQVFLKMKTGGEHNSHAIRKGPDGWWYLIAGNTAGITSGYATISTSPITKPNAGVILRFAPDLSGGEIFCDGFRNAYDFDFGPYGEIYSYDSDGERDITMPWYRPTRLYQSLPKSDHGWVSRSWKRDGSFPTMPPVVGKFGRGSPTGVVCYRHTQFPKKYRNTLFIEDWTYGRVINVQLGHNGSAVEGIANNFLTAKGQYGFAPVDIEVGKDGSLYVAIGGRGTRGGVYKISYPKETPIIEAAKKDLSHKEKLDYCLTAPQPLSSWSRARWIPYAKELKAEPFHAVIVEDTYSNTERIRAIEIVTELFGGPDDDMLTQLSKDPSSELRARAVWAYGRHRSQNPDVKAMSPFLSDKNPWVVRCAVEALYATPTEQLTHFVDLLIKLTNTDDKYVREAVANLLKHLSRDDFRAVGDQGRKQGWNAALTIARAFQKRNPGYNSYAITIGVGILQRELPLDMQLAATHLIQDGLGGIVPKKDDFPAVFDGYTPGADLKKNEKEADQLRTELARIYPIGETAIDHEILRLITMLAPKNEKLFTKLLLEMNEESHPVDDIHRLLAISRMPVERTSAQRKRIASALIQIDAKIEKRKLPQDSNWQDRFSELYSHLVKKDSGLPSAIVADSNFGRPAHIPFISEVGEEDFQKAVDAFVKNVRNAKEDYNWTNEIVYVLGQSGDPEVFEMLREQKENFAIRASVLIALAENLDPKDRPSIVEGLDAPQLDVIESCVTALKALPESDGAMEQIALVSSARRLNANEREYLLREQIIDVLRRNTKQDFGFVAGKEGRNPQQEVMNKWSNWLKETYPKEVALHQNDSVDMELLKKQLAQIDWTLGDANRGKKIFTARTCIQCHGSRKALGPDLNGVAGRFSKEDLFTAIVDPHRDVSPRYQTTLIGTNAGKVYTGMIVYESIDGLLLRNDVNQTFRIETDQIAFRKRLKTSLMPTGLLKKITDQELADLYAYLSSLGQNKSKTASITPKKEVPKPKKAEILPVKQ